MSQHDFNIANQSFPATRTDLNNALQALASNSSGDAEPSTTFANQWWYETDTNTLKLRNEANNAWLSFATVDQTTGATIADGSSPPKVPTMFGGNGTTTYGTYTWFEAQELATAFGKYTLTQLEFMSAMYGTTEASSIGTDPSTTNWDAAYVSKWGVNQATGCMYVWGRDRGGPAAAASWNANTEGRGSEYNAPNAVLFGGAWDGGSNSGSRFSLWNSAASLSGNTVGSRFACDHLQLG
jgi:hypothetical protein